MPRASSLLLVTLTAACATPTPEASPPAELTVVTWNIHHGRGADGVVDLDRIAAVLRVLDADVIALQEVDVGVERTARLDTPTELGRRLGMTPLFGHNLDFQGGQYGNALLTRAAVRSWRNHRYTMLRAGEQRGALVVTLDTTLGPLTVVVTHLDYRPDDAERLAHVDELAAITRDAPGGAIVVGDFNAEPSSSVHAKARHTFTDAWLETGAGDGNTYPADAPRKRIDWLLLRDLVGGSTLDVRDARVIDERAASDHRPVRAVLRRWE